MDELNDVIFLDAEIIDDDDTAPVGTLMNSYEQQADLGLSKKTEIADKKSVDETGNEPTAPVKDDTTASAVESASNVDANDDTQPIIEEKKADVAKVSKPKTVKKQTSQPVKNTVASTKVHVAGESSINDLLGSSSFEVQQPAKSSVISTKKKQEKVEDVWSVAPIAQRKPQQKQAPAPIQKKAVAQKTTPKAEDKKDVKQAPKQTTAKQNTATKNVDIKNTKAEENKKMAKETKTAVANEIEWIQEPTEKYAGTYVIKKTDKGNFVFKLFAYNKNCLAIGAQPYTSIAGCKGGINSIINNAATAPVINCTLKDFDPKAKLPNPRWEIYEDKKGEFRLRLFASNGNLVATTNDGYMQASGAKKGIESIAKASVGCGVRRDDNLW